MLPIVVFSVASFLFGYVVAGVYCLATLSVGAWCGGTVKRVGLGAGPGMISFPIRNAKVELRPFPWTGFVEFVEPDEDPSEYPDVTPATSTDMGWVDLPISRRVATLMSGPLTQIAVGVALLLLPMALSGPQLTVTAEGNIQPTATPGLTVTKQETTVAGQWHFVQYTLGAYFLKLFTLRSLDGWGGLIGFATTSGAVANSEVSAWPTCLALFAITMGSLGMLPLPFCNGSAILISLLDWATGREPAVRESTPGYYQAIQLAGLPVALLLLGRVILLDVWWVLSLF